MKRIMARRQAVEVRDLTKREHAAVAGGGIMQDIEERHPGGEWVGGSYYPNGAPRMPGTVGTFGVNEG